MDPEKDRSEALVGVLQGAGLQRISARFIKEAIVPQLVDVNPSDIERVDLNMTQKFINNDDGEWEQVSLADYHKIEFVGTKVDKERGYSEVLSEFQVQLKPDHYKPLHLCISVTIKDGTEKSYFFIIAFAAKRT